MDNTKRKGIPVSYTRDTAWKDIVYAQAAFGVKDYYTATLKATEALLACKEIESIMNIAVIKDLYLQILNTSFKGDSSVKTLGLLLKR